MDCVDLFSNQKPQVEIIMLSICIILVYIYVIEICNGMFPTSTDLFFVVVVYKQEFAHFCVNLKEGVKHKKAARWWYKIRYWQLKHFLQ